ncbi:Bacteriophage lambda, Stf, side tail fibre-repeat-2 [uncultured Caudovirales phage]|uniref:Bacteriophage lambda, Stf, side tail fibre-repeat-2 n=1 Tax=uncultured Caudovirales phage TaxID=2100421 RepID=A0A6J5P8L0_9CAUD|nr:Bacteriophage lambda, Stf, side tail fibre-repeat-2 [uncultured Caudovirales phage]
MPTATDLVTDLPADFNVFGQGVDTSMADLLGGTTGQILAKTSNTNMDFTWTTPNPGDITGVAVTSPITGGGTSGDVTIGIQDASTAQKGSVQLSDSTSTTSSVLAATPTAVKSAYDLANAAIAKSTLTTAGDTLYRNATVPARLAIGTAGQLLRVNSGATAPEWATVSSSPTYVGCSLSNSASQSISNATQTTVTFDTEQWDTDGIHSTSSNTGRFTVPAGKGGKWRLSGTLNGDTSGTNWSLFIYVNGSYFITGFPQFSQIANGGGTGMFTLSYELNLAAADYIELKAEQASGGAANIRGQYSRVFFSYIGA